MKPLQATQLKPISINALSVFDGISCGQIALNNIPNIKVENYFRSEIDKYANQVAEKNYPNSINLGSVLDWRNWDIDWSSIDFLIGGSPCQGFSSAGKRHGTKAIYNGTEIIVTDRETYLELKKKGAEFLSQSYLFWEYVLIIDHVKKHNPNVKFLLENVKMKKELLEMIDTALGVKSIVINSCLLSAQRRTRHYWCNWHVTQPHDKKIYLKDIVIQEPEYSVKVGKTLRNTPKRKINNFVNNTLRVGYLNGGSIGDRIYSVMGKSPCLLANSGGNAGNGSCLVEVPEKDTNQNELFYRKLTPVECERLQTIPDNYTDCVSASQRYKQIGNGWTVDVITHILKQAV